MQRQTASVKVFRATVAKGRHGRRKGFALPKVVVAGTDESGFTIKKLVYANSDDSVEVSCKVKCQRPRPNERKGC